MSEKDTKLRDCFLINEFTARDLKQMFHVYGGRREIDKIEFGISPKRWVKITYGHRSPETTMSEARPEASGNTHSLSEKAKTEVK
jgi:hypothetical protein